MKGLKASPSSSSSKNEGFRECLVFKGWLPLSLDPMISHTRSFYSTTLFDSDQKEKPKFMYIPSHLKCSPIFLLYCGIMLGQILKGILVKFVVMVYKKATCITFSQHSIGVDIVASVTLVYVKSVI